MSREIKFKAWMENKMLSHEDLVDMDQEFYAMYTILTEPQEDITFMQYTGLKDKHGTEIFEGDIVQFKSIRDIIERYEVEYTNYGEWAIGMHRLSMRFKSCEVIGNIYEHSHLLEGTA
ncbi:YopX family protein [Lysinibacillus sp. BSL11]